VGGSALAMLGVLKDDGDTEGIETFQNKYFPFPLYIDKQQVFYKELGNRKLYAQPFSSWNVFKLVQSFAGLRQRLKAKGNIEGNYKGEGLLQGGVILVSRKKGVVYQHAEETGSELPVDEIESKVIEYSR
jgi:hypothetical protein